MEEIWKFEVFLYSFHEGIFLATQEDIDSIIGKEIYFGELEGKHSDVSLVMEASMFTKLDVSDKFLGEFKKHRELLVGVNPLNYL